jgi:hypothetical protein
VEDTDSRVKVAKTVWRDLKGLARMRRFEWGRAQKTHRLQRAISKDEPATVRMAMAGADAENGDHCGE